MGLRFDVAAEPSPSPGPARPEEVFLSWLMALPETADPALAAEVEILRLKKYAGPHPGPARLLALFNAFRETLDAHADNPSHQ